MKRIKEALEQARNDGILGKSTVVDGPGVKPVLARSKSWAEVTPNSDEALSRIPFMELDESTLKKNLIFKGSETDSFSMSYKMLRTQVYQKMQQNEWTTLGITSSNTGEGKSLTSLNLAFSLSRASSQPIILLDLDLRRPTLISKLGVAPEFGITDYFIHGKDLSQVLVRITENLILAPGVESIKDASEILGSKSMERLLYELVDSFPGSLILFDLPPVLVVDDVMALSPLLDCCLLVTEEGRTKSHELEQSLDLLQITNLLGIVLNRSGEVEKNHYYSSY